MADAVMFNPDFYPTPPEVAAEMLDPLDLRGRVVLEPSAGTWYPPSLGTGQLFTNLPFAMTDHALPTPNPERQ